MEWLYDLFFEQTALQAVIIISLIISTGLALGKIHVCGISLGVTFVFFMGILAGHSGLAINPQMLNYAESFGLVLFVYALGLQVGPGFFSSLRQGGCQLNLLGLGVILLGTIMAIVLTLFTPISMSDMVGILCGATTNTPALGAAQQTLKQLGEPTSGAALSCAVTYPLGVVGVILAIVAVRKLFVRPSDMEEHPHDDPNHTYIGTYQVHNPAIFGKSIHELVHMGYSKFVISRLWRDGQVCIPTSDKVLQENDRLLVVTTEKDVEALTILFGEQEQKDWNKEDIDWNAIDSQLISKHIVISRPEINGKKLGSLRLRNVYGINISRVLRSGVQLLATPELVLQLGDRLTVVGEAAAIKNVEKVLGNTVKTLKDPNLASIFIGIVLGLIVGSIPIAIPGISTPVKLGLAGGPIVAGILIGSYGPRLHMLTYTTRSASLMLRGIGLSLYLACLGLDAGAHFFETVMRPEGALWVGIGFIITFVPVVIMALVALRCFHLDFGNTCGMLCGSMANPMALNYANDIIPNDNPAVSYATVYPLGMFTRVIIAQLILMLFL
ncbi:MULTISPECIES: putative transporter [Bacteroidaceae]|uniref:Transporter n=1 Tax=Phocaeicola intestinalis TaxID=2762212 RepID=A0ABR8Y4A1_9BACT|nr:MULTISPECIES: putative transporter [Bacteroidaceae]CCZ70932.1 yidE/YbjL duplication [Bacteroides sp. CAG:702]MBD8039030.1 putative transporter [Phocaeicola intestinalis]MBM6658327.1 putative transporter [Bacteroides gallinaceum]MBM6719083.1 putative transporter [Bacteroides gallinaceum]OUN80222.1 transporter [Bacteroides sp. An51A]